MIRFPRTSLALVATVVGLGTGSVDEAAADTVSCGQTITVNTTLQASVGPCDEGLVIGADNIVLDLNGYTLSGTNKPHLDEPGIDTNHHGGVTIRNGTVTGFAAGVALSGGSGNTVMGMLLRDNVGSLRNEGDYGDGLAVLRSDHNRITANRLIHNGTYDGIGLFNSSYNVVEYNVVVDNTIPQVGGTNQPVVMRDSGIWVASVFGVSTENVLRFNQIHRNGLHGVLVDFFSFRIAVQANLVAQNGFGQVAGNPLGLSDGSGIHLEGSGNVVAANTVTVNAGHGIAVADSPFVGGAGRANTIRANTSIGNNRGGDPGPAFDLSDSNPACDANVWAANTFVTFNQPCVTGP